MTDDLFESLLFEEEGTGIDLKKEQYCFVNASDDEKSELVKDIVGFANAWRREKAYILVGVEEVRGGKSNVLGIDPADQLDDHALQQFINSLVNTPVHFQYRAFSYQGKQVGIFVLDEGQQRPVYLTRNYGKLAKEKVYVRRGSSTNPQKPALPEEIARMGAGRPRERAELVVEFAELDRDDAIGAGLQLRCECCSVPARENIPEVPVGDRFTFMARLSRTNTEYYRELAVYEFLSRLCRRVRLVVRNVGQVAANNVHVELVIPTASGLLPRLELPEKPTRELALSRLPHMQGGSWAGIVGIDQNEDRYRIEIDCKDLQPGRRIWSDTFFIGAGRSSDYFIQGEVFADNLPTPQPFTMTVNAVVEQTTLTLKDLYSR